MNSPFILVDGHDVYVYASADELVRDVEAVDVAHGTFQVMDADGRPVELFVERSEPKSAFALPRESVVLRPVKDAAPDQERIRELLQSALQAAGVPTAELSCEELLARASEYLRG